MFMLFTFYFVPKVIALAIRLVKDSKYLIISQIDMICYRLCVGYLAFQEEILQSLVSDVNFTNQELMDKAMKENLMWQVDWLKMFSESLMANDSTGKINFSEDFL